MVKKRILSMVIAGAMLLSLAACSPATEETPVSTQLPSSSAEQQSPEKTGSGTSQGFGGAVTATITVVDGKITACTLEGPNETAGIGAAALPTLEKQVVAAGSADIDGVAGATYTSTGVREAVQIALNAANGILSDGTLAFAPGTYRGEGYGKTKTIQVDVTVSENAITNIELVKGKETAVIFDTAWDNVTSDILTYQSLDVDMVSGATLSSRAIVAAVSEALSEAGADMSVLKAPRLREQKGAAEIEKTADVIVVGGGGAGLVAAVTAVEQGASVIVIEKAAYTGGNLLVFGGIFNTPDAQLQSQLEMRSGVKETIEAAISAEPVSEEHKAAMEAVKADYEAWQAAGSVGLFDSDAWFSLQTWNSGDKLAKKQLVDIMTSNAYDGYQWLQSIGVEFLDKITQGAGSLYQRTHTAAKPNGSGLIGAYMEQLEKEPDKCEILLNTAAEDFIMEGNAVVGVTARDAAGNTYTLKANQGVVLSTGGFAGNVELRQKYCEGEKWPDLGTGVLTTNLPNVTGDGILMAEKIGASFVNMDQIQLLHLGNPFTGATGGTASEKTASANEVVFVNAEGNRFVAEDARRDVICNAIAAQPGSFYWIIHNSREEGFDPYSETVEDCIKGGYIYRAESLEELAEITGMPADNLIASINEYNEAVERGVDEHLGRTLLTDLVDEDGPWFATKKVASAHHTMGGVEINENAQVLYPDGSVIPGLYAAGEVTGGIHGGNRVGGNASVDTVVFGRIAGANAAQNK